MGRRRNTSARAWWQACWLTRCRVLWANGCSPKGRRRSLILGANTGVWQGPIFQKQEWQAPVPGGQGPESRVRQVPRWISLKGPLEQLDPVSRTTASKPSPGDYGLQAKQMQRRCRRGQEVLA